MTKVARWVRTLLGIGPDAEATLHVGELGRDDA